MSNFNVSGPHSNLTDQTPGVNENGKRSIRNLATATPGQVRARPTHPRGPSSVPRIGSGLTVQKYSSNIHQSTNNTSSVPLFAKAKVRSETDSYCSGSLLFALGGNTRLSSVRDLCEMNARDEMRLANHSIVCGFRPEKGALFFFGSLRNEMGRIAEERLFNVDVHGRTKIGNIFGHVRRGDRVGLGVCSVKANSLGVHERKDVILPFLNGNVIQDLRSSVLGPQHSVFRNWYPTTCQNTIENTRKTALLQHDKYTTLPQIEYLWYK